MAASRWGDVDVQTIDISIDQPIPTNTRKNHTSIWHQFTEFCSSKNYSLTPVTTTITLNQILKDFAWNMRKTDGTEYKETVIKVLWNTTAKLLQQYYFDNFNIIFNPFNDVEFKTARAARDAKRKKLLSDGTKRKLSLFTSSLSDRQEKAKLHKVYDENTPEGLLEKFYKVVAPELGWKNVEGSAAEITHFSREIDYKGNETGRIEYNPATVWRPDCKRLIPNRDDPEVCPVRLFNLVLERRPSHITINRLLLFPNNFWREKNSKGWYKNMPVGKKLINKWLSNTPSEDVVELDEPPCTDKASTAIATQIENQNSSQLSQFEVEEEEEEAPSLQREIRLEMVGPINSGQPIVKFEVVEDSPCPEDADLLQPTVKIEVDDENNGSFECEYTPELVINECSSSSESEYRSDLAGNEGNQQPEIKFEVEVDSEEEVPVASGNARLADKGIQTENGLEDMWENRIKKITITLARRSRRTPKSRAQASTQTVSTGSVLRKLLESEL